MKDFCKQLRIINWSLEKIICGNVPEGFPTEILANIELEFSKAVNWVANEKNINVPNPMFSDEIDHILESV